MVKDTQIVREETCCPHIGYSFRLAARVLLYGSSHRQDNTYDSLCYTSRGALAGMNEWMFYDTLAWRIHWLLTNNNMQKKLNGQQQKNSVKSYAKQQQKFK